ncbi:uncharacterized protein LOC120084489 [Benincasa hispida]|uniref:uncharacterized protein LOC120084489 n=1 Tax=Benincasa hispida TaxID=102211 RepID=UPI0018FF44ED|nr:uncharacterized protein LOC120084489 [Benincasa hispida]
MTIGTDMQVKEIACSCCKDPLAILSSDKKRWAERNQKLILYEFQALSLAMENRCFGITKPFLVIFMIFKSLFGPSCQAGHNADDVDDPFVGGKHAWNEVRVDMSQISFMEMERDEEIG